MKLILFDFKNTVRTNAAVIGAAIILLLIGCFYFRSSSLNFVNAYNQNRQNSGAVNLNEDSSSLIPSEISSSDYMLFMFRGMYPIDEKIQNEGGKIDIPVMYLALMVIFTVMTTKYIFSDISKFSFYKSGSGMKWIFSKLASIFVLIGFVYLTGIVIAIIFGGDLYGYNEQLNIKAMKVEFCHAFGYDIFKLIAMAFLNTFVISVVQVAVSLYFNYYFGILSSVGIYILSLFSQNPFFLGNGSMVQRSQFFLTGGFQITEILFVDMLVLLAGTGLIMWKMKRYDML